MLWWLRSGRGWVDGLLLRDALGEDAGPVEGGGDRVGGLLERGVGLGGADDPALQRAPGHVAVETCDQAALLIDHEVDEEGHVEVLTRHGPEPDGGRGAAALGQQSAGRSGGDGESVALERGDDELLGGLVVADQEEVVGGRHGGPSSGSVVRARCPCRTRSVTLPVDGDLRQTAGPAASGAGSENAP